MAPPLHRLRGLRRARATSSTGAASTYVNTDLPTGRRVPRRLGGVHHGLARGERGGVRPARAGRRRRLGAPVRRRSWRTPISPSGSSARSSGRRRASRSGSKALRRLGRRGLLEFAGTTLVSCRDWVTETFQSEAAHGVLAPWVLHTGLGPEQATSGLHDAGDRAPPSSSAACRSRSAAASASSTRSRGSSPTRAARCGCEADVERVARLERPRDRRPARGRRGRRGRRAPSSRT